MILSEVYRVFRHVERKMSVNMPCTNANCLRQKIHVPPYSVILNNFLCVIKENRGHEPADIPREGFTVDAGVTGDILPF